MRDCDPAPKSRPRRFQFPDEIFDAPDTAKPRLRAAARRRCFDCGKPSERCTCGTDDQSGRWVRRGRTIIVNC